MIKRLFKSATCARPGVALALLSVCLGAGGCGTSVDRQVLDVSSEANVTTSPFRVPGKWDLKYSWDCGAAIAQGHRDADGFQLDLINADDDSNAAENPKIRRSGRTGGATLHLKRPGQYYFVIQSPCHSRIQVEDTSA